MEQGLTDEPQVETKARAAKRIGELYAYTSQHRRLWEARYLLYLYVSLLDGDIKAPNILREFLDIIGGTSFELEKAQTLLDLAEWQIRFDYPTAATEVEQHLQSAQSIFKNLDHVHGVLDVADIRLLIPNASITTREVFDAKCKNANDYFSRSCYLKGLRCLLFAIPKAFNEDRLDGLVEKSIDTLHKTISDVGAEFLVQVTFLDITSQSLLRAPEYGLALQSLETYARNPPIEIGPKYHSSLYLSLRKVYSSLGNTVKAIECAKTALDISSRNRNSYYDQSDAALELGLAEWNARVLHATGSAGELEHVLEAIKILQIWVEKDASNSYLEGEQTKCHQLGIIENYLFRFHGLKDSAHKSKQWWERSRRGHQESSTPLYEDIDARVQELITESKFEEALCIAKSNLEQWQSAMEPPRFHLANGFFRIASVLHISAKHMVDADSFTSNHTLEYVQTLMTVLQYSYQALKIYRGTGGAEMTVTCTNHIWLAIQDIRVLFEDFGLELLKKYLEEMTITETFCDNIRRSFASTEKVQSLLSKRQLVSNEEQRKFYALAVLSCIQLNDPESAWTWIQKGKARALSDLFGIRALIPSDLLHIIYNDPVANKLYEQELKSTKNCLHASPQAYIGAARKAKADRDAMMAVPALAQLLAIREGAFDITLEALHMQQAQNASKFESQKLKYVDWYFLTNSEGAPETIVLFVRNLSGSTSFRELKINVSDVQRWMKKVFEHPEGAEPELKIKSGNRTLWELNGLLDGLDALTDEDDLLILSPCGILNSVPIHGLKVAGRVLIDRNLVIYSSSAAVFRQCQARAANPAGNSIYSGRSEAIHNRYDFLAVYEESSRVEAEEQTEIFTSVNKIARNFEGNVLLGQEVSKPKFTECCRDASWLFYHGHATYNKQDVLDSGLVLSDDDLTTSDIFDDVSMRNAPHITIIACDSGTQHIAPGDEPLGIVPALLFAGATSVLGCIWPIESWAGRLFSEKFHTHLRKQVVDEHNTGGSHHFVNIATALREAVREMMDKKSVETRLPYFWAPFVLHGCWFHTEPKST